jgi:thiosulfate reductase cytochrome b subunit
MIIVLTFFVLVFAGGALAQDASCIACHDDQKVYQQSVHKSLKCSDCHQGFTDFPHPEPGPNEKSPVSRSRVIEICARCHGDLKFVEDHRIPGRLLPVINYQQSVHGRAVSGGKLGAANCADCHGSHEILAPTEPRSKVSRANTPSTCGQCHKNELAQYQRSVHGVAHAQGKSGVPTCTDCHGIHTIDHPGDAAKSDAEKALGKASCSRCHASEVLSREYALPLDRVRTYLDSYHGLASQRGSPAVANCASCHGVHEILASADRNSSVHPANLPATCGKCHPGASANFARGSVHAGSGGGQRVLHWVSTFYVLLIVVVIAGMVIHNVVDFRAKLRGVATTHMEEFFVRSEVIQHGVLLGSFTVLVLTGFALKWPDSIFGILVPLSEQLRRWIHRFAGAVMLALFVGHAVRLVATRRGREFLRRFRPAWRDIGFAFENFVFNLRLGGARPLLKYPTYIEKAEYWALIWGVVIMGGTGVLLWFENLTLRLFPLWVLNLLTVVHFYEALLATLAIVVWHLYFVVLDPTVYPLKSIKRTRPSEQ